MRNADGALRGVMRQPGPKPWQKGKNMEKKTPFEEYLETVNRNLTTCGLTPKSPETEQVYIHIGILIHFDEEFKKWIAAGRYDLADECIDMKEYHMERIHKLMWERK